AFLAQQGPQGETPATSEANESDYSAGAPPEMFYQPPAPAEAKKAPAPKTASPPPPEEVTYDEPESLAAAEQMALITSEYSADPYGPGRAQIYMTITIEQTFLLKVEFNDFPARPRVVLPPSVTSVLGDPYKTLKVLADWREDNPNDVVEIIREIERRLYSLKDAETQAKEILGEYRAEKIDDSIAHLHVHVMTFGFKEFFLDIDLTPFPQVPEIKYSPELADLIQVEPEDLDAVKSWKSKSSQAVDIIREISWLVDKNSRLKFELELIENGIKNVSYDPATNVLEIKMAGEMKTKDVNFDFKVSIPPAYPTEPPKVELVTELDEDQEDVKKGINKSMKDYFAQWNTFSFLIDLFNAISKAIFNVSVLTCVLCHKIECPACNVKIAAPEGEETCQARCPHCERDYHKHCWEQTIQAFGKCGFCLRVP
ncbi:MAG TPA: hypothetical protein VKK79_14445, partial [Candidatus Lokiarchaeia archaeon]|nr:hypothetical protein [Candidatus Lokiarchaeia archaeon]